MKIGIGSYAYRWAIGRGPFVPDRPLTPWNLLDKAVTHGVDEGHVLDARLLHPDHVVEQQVMAVGRGQPGEGRPGTVDQDTAKFAHFGVDTIGDRHDLLLQAARVATLRHAMMMTVRIRSSGHMKASHRS